MKTRLIYFIFAGLLLNLSSCMVGPKFSAPETDNPEVFANDNIEGDSTVSLEWFEVLGDSILINLIDSALSNNKNLLMAASRIEQSRAYLGFTKADMYPSFGYTFESQGANFNPNTGAKSDFNMHMGGASVNWEIDFWGKFRRSNQAARADLVADEFAKEWIKLTLISDVVEAYFQLLDYDRRVEISQRTLDSRTESLEIIGKKFYRGVSPELDYNQSQIQQAMAAQAVPLYKRQVAITENRLSILLGQNPGPIIRERNTNLTIDSVNIPVGLPSELLLRRADVQEAMQQLKAQNARIGVAQAMRFPSISLTGVLGIVSNDLSTLFDNGGIYQVSGGLLGPIFQFGKNKRRVEMEREKTNQLRLQYEQTVLVAFQEVENALISVNTLKEEYKAITDQVEAAKSAANLSNKRYDGGVTSFLEVLDSERSYFNSEITASEVSMQRLSAYVLLYKSLGGGWKIPEELIEE
ncbi:efflux transporter outer membrane subunit [Saccharicrinis aurantiacus]|uniref:efflux transporter outer membrane subunit n=1 Tax=Saccharicrinis aurantiacus TaxID=1849719 RepID=UPI0008384B6B|nr:efflux transporter outer membrane subunit [Saccharicrinis aurantiacus]